MFACISQVREHPYREERQVHLLGHMNCGRETHWETITNFPWRNNWSLLLFKPTRSYLTKNKKARVICDSGTWTLSVHVHTATFLHYILYRHELQIFSVKAIRSVRSRQPRFGLGDVSVLFHITSFCSKLWLLGHGGGTIPELLV